MNKNRTVFNFFISEGILDILRKITPKDQLKDLQQIGQNKKKNKMLKDW